MTEESVVLYEVNDGIATITLNRPDSLNAMTNPLMQGLGNALAKVRQDQSVRAVILTGRGRGFCSGADLSERGAASDDTIKASDNEKSDGVDHFNSAMRALNDCPVPTIARINGPAAGGGFGLALACDITIAAESAFFVATFGPKLGIVPDMGATWSIPGRVGRARALGITLLGERINAHQAQEWGLIWRAVADDALDDAINEVAVTLKNSSPETVTRIRKTIDGAAQHTFSEQLDIEMTHQAVLIPRNMAEGARAFMEKRAPSFVAKRED